MYFSTVIHFDLDTYVYISGSVNICKNICYNSGMQN